MSLLSMDFKVQERDLIYMIQEIAQAYEKPTPAPISELDLANVELRLQAVQKSRYYDERSYCDVPGPVLQRMIDYIRATNGVKP